MYFKNGLFLIVKKKISFLYMSVLPACMSVPCVCLVSLEARRVYWIPSNWNYGLF